METETIEDRCEHAQLPVADNVLSKIGLGGSLYKCKNPDGPCHQVIDMGYPWPFNSHYCGVESMKKFY